MSQNKVKVDFILNSGERKKKLSVLIPKNSSLLEATLALPIKIQTSYHKQFGAEIKGFEDLNENSEGFGWQFYIKEGSEKGLPFIITEKNEPKFPGAENIKVDKSVTIEWKYECYKEDIKVGGCAGAFIKLGEQFSISKCQLFSVDQIEENKNYTSNISPYFKTSPTASDIINPKTTHFQSSKFIDFNTDSGKNINIISQFLTSLNSISSTAIFPTLYIPVLSSKQTQLPVSLSSNLPISYFDANHQNSAQIKTKIKSNLIEPTKFINRQSFFRIVKEFNILIHVNNLKTNTKRIINLLKELFKKFNIRSKSIKHNTLLILNKTNEKVSRIFKLVTKLPVLISRKMASIPFISNIKSISLVSPKITSALSTLKTKLADNIRRFNQSRLVRELIQLWNDTKNYFIRLRSSFDNISRILSLEHRKYILSFYAFFLLVAFAVVYVYLFH